jgi:hypothetical protein
MVGAVIILFVLQKTSSRTAWYEIRSNRVGMAQAGGQHHAGID